MMEFSRTSLRENPWITQTNYGICVYIYILVGGFNPAEKYEIQLG
jgi:hypothetical protein